MAETNMKPLGQFREIDFGFTSYGPLPSFASKTFDLILLGVAATRTSQIRQYSILL